MVDVNVVKWTRRNGENGIEQNNNQDKTQCEQIKKLNCCKNIRAQKGHNCMEWRLSPAQPRCTLHRAIEKVQRTFISKSHHVQQQQITKQNKTKYCIHRT